MEQSQIENVAETEIFGTSLLALFKEAGITRDRFTNDNTHLEPQTLFVFTLTRDDIIELTQRIMRAIPSHLLTDTENPLCVSVNGSLASGKKIIPDFARSELLPDTSNVKGNKDFDEYYDGPFKGQDITMSFINVAWGCDYSFASEYGDKQDVLVDKHMKARTNTRGIAFIHNPSSYQGADDKSGLSIWIESEIRSPVYGADRRIDTTFRLRLKNHFSSEPSCVGETWPRYFEITIHHPDLLKSAQFMDELNALGMRPASERFDETPVFQAKPVSEASQPVQKRELV